MKIYLATAGEYSDFRVCHAFTKREDAEAYALGDDVMEMELSDSPVEVRTWHTLWWDSARPDQTDLRGYSNPYESSYPRDFDGDPRHAEHRWNKDHNGVRTTLIAGGWDRDQVRKVYSEQRAQHLAKAQGISD
jgi:hypothetical protein